MCPPLSCCHRWPTRPSALRQRLYYLVRLLAASDAEVPASQRARLANRLNELRDYLHEAMQHYYQVSPGRAQELVGQVALALLREDCCRQSIRATVSLAEALGLSELAAGAPRWPLGQPLAPAQAEYSLA